MMAFNIIFKAGYIASVGPGAVIRKQHYLIGG